VALEPLLRRRWPGTLVSWNRLLAGRLRDPLVGRDVLAGVVGWWVFVALSIPVFWAPKWLGLAPARPSAEADLTALLGPLGVGASLIDSLLLPVVVSFFFLFLLLLVGLVLRKMWLAVAVIFLFLSFNMLMLIPSHPAAAVIQISQGLLFWGIFLLIISRFGLLSLCVWHVCSAWSINTAIGRASAGWYQGIAHFFLLASAALLLYAVLASIGWLGRRPAYSEDS
jgi:serine/threonine-protein kinase